MRCIASEESIPFYAERRNMLKEYRSLLSLLFVAIVISFGARVWVWYETSFLEFSGPNIGIGGLALLGDSLIAIAVITLLVRFLLDRCKTRAWENREADSSHIKTKDRFSRHRNLKILFLTSVSIFIFTGIWDLVAKTIFNAPDTYIGLFIYGVVAFLTAVVTGIMWTIKAFANNP